jgi:hypothetical protein
VTSLAGLFSSRLLDDSAENAADVGLRVPDPGLVSDCLTGETQQALLGEILEGVCTHAPTRSPRMGQPTREVQHFAPERFVVGHV